MSLILKLLAASGVAVQFVSVCDAAPPDRSGTGAAVVTSTDSVRSQRHWVVFRDKAVPEAELGTALRAFAAAAPARMIERRDRRRSAPGLVDVRDLPVASEYVARLVQCGATVRHTSRWLNAASVTATPEQLRAIAALPFVEAVRHVRAGRRMGVIDETEAAGPGPYGSRDFYGRASAQLNQINLPALHQLGFTGEGVIIGVLDTGFQRTHAAFNAPGRPLDVIAERDFVADDLNTAIESGDDSEQHRHGTWILGTIGAYQPDELVGGAYDASFVLAKTEDVTGETPIEEDNYVAGLEFIEFHGADIATSSLGYIDWYTQADLDGATAVTTIAVNVATANGLACITAAGNAGHDGNPATSTLGAPADALDVISCGAVDGAGVIAGFSSSGPTADGRIKPELLAWGVNTSTVSSRTDTGFGVVSGTSLSTPLVAAAAACLLEAHPNWTVRKLRGQLNARASDFVANGVADPLFIRGYGILNAAAAHNLSCAADMNGDQGVGIEDLLEYLDYYDSGRLAADLDNGQGGGTPDNGVGIEDLLYYLVRYDAGC